MVSYALPVSEPEILHHCFYKRMILSGLCEGAAEFGFVITCKLKYEQSQCYLYVCWSMRGGLLRPRKYSPALPFELPSREADVLACQRRLVERSPATGVREPVVGCNGLRVME